MLFVLLYAETDGKSQSRVKRCETIDGNFRDSCDYLQTVLQFELPGKQIRILQSTPRLLMTKSYLEVK